MNFFSIVCLSLQAARLMKDHQSNLSCYYVWSTRLLYCIPNKQFLEAERCLPFTQTTRRGVEILCIDIKTIDNFTKSIKYLVYTPKCAIIVVFDFSWGDCIKRRKKTGNNGNEEHGGGEGVNKVHMVSLKMVSKVWERASKNCFQIGWTD